jgi:hypothetical protein
MAFYFAWVDKTDTTWDEDFAREDEAIFGLVLEQEEGEFAALDIDLINPRIGLLAPSRKQWAWLTYRKQDNTLVPLFFGRLVGIPQEMQDNVVRLAFVARPVDFEDQKEALAETLKVAPYYDPAFFAEEEKLDPDHVLEGRSALWHIDRTTGLVTVSDIVTAEDGQIDFQDDEVQYDSVSVSYSQSPASRCEVTATVEWDQAGRGTIDLTSRILKAFEDLTVTGLTSIDHRPLPTDGVINVFGGKEMIANWPKFGANIGGGWTVGVSKATVVGEPPLPPLLAEPGITNIGANFFEQFPGSRGAVEMIFTRSPGFIVNMKDLGDPSWEDGVPGKTTILWVNAWQIAPKLKLNWEASRSRTETLTFTVTADVQPLLTDPGEEEVIRLNVGPVDVDDYMHDVRSRRYFNTDRGRESLTYLLGRARASLLNRARAVDVSFDVPFEAGLAITLRKSASIQDPRLPNGVAAGKIKGYRLACDGDSGKLTAGLTIGCVIGRDGEIEVVDGDPSYVEEGYVEEGYQEYDGAVVVPFAGDLGFTLGTYPVTDDGANLYGVSPFSHLISLNVSGGVDQHKAQVEDEFFETPTLAMDTINGVLTTVRVVLKPVAGGPYFTPVAPTVTELKVPKTIDLE